MDRLRPTTLLLGAIAVWALAVLVLGLLGLGGRISLAPDNRNLAPALPHFTLTRIDSRLGPLSDYQQVADRPLLLVERRPVAISAGPNADTSDFDVMLTSVLITPRLQMAILTDNQGGASRRVRVGETVAGTSWRLQQLQPRSATFESPAGERVLDLRVYDGSGGAPATAVAPIAQGDAGARGSNEASTETRATPPVATASNPKAPMVGIPMLGADNGQQQPPQTQEQQISAIRARIEARRAQARAEEIREVAGQK